ncbi:XRE family transcriptional regulator [Streptomyces sp. Ag109_G2-15]|uniref:helix-turn-helix domain-containing protein n=1 Tax=Streptomyces sp. Ag109_G2-15 TaxID=1938850 RepID=UPI000BCEAA9A|nr:XRE family transcriptional regulator [Streptomyces sp. Ag109_G2-15]SOD84309.1 Helix-turn-helix domain-containing protein [Streptomyces sp. Ag109_G2-15]
MPRWKALPDELDPQIKEFTSQVRRLVDRSGLSIAALADRTGYSKTSWERYLGGRLLAPKGAIVALAEVTGTNPVHLTTMWELAERAWSRAEMRHDRTMEQIRIAQARAALGEFGAAEAEAAEGASGTKTARRGAGTTAIPGIAGPAGVSPTIPPQPTASDADGRENADRGAASDVNSWGLAGYEGPSKTSRRPAAGAGAGAAAGVGAGAGARPESPADGPGWTPDTPNPYDGQPQAARPAGGTSAKGRKGAGRKGRLTMFLAGLVGVLVVVAAVYFFTNLGGGTKHEGAAKSPSPTASSNPSLPVGVKCSGAACNGKDAEAMGCSGDLVTTAKTATVGTTILEVRYSKTCGTAWGRITGAAQGDRVQLSAGKLRQTGDITATGDTIAYTPMVAVKDAAEAKACATLASGRTGCTK